MSFHRQGSLTIYMGSMCSGKSKRLIDDLTRYVDSIPLRVCYINTIDDVRETETVEEGVTTHSSSGRISKKIHRYSVKKLNGIDHTKYDVLGVDESQFFDDLYETVLKWLDDNKIVICSGLDGDYRRQPFGQIFSLIPHAENAIKLSANCVECLKEWHEGRSIYVHPAPFTKRTIQSEEQILIGGTDMYIPVCRFHFS